MAKLTPFRALRPRAELAARISSVPYDVVSTVEARDLAADEPLSFLRVTRSELELPGDADPYAAEVYDRARATLERLKAERALETELEASVYVYRLRMGGHVQTGVAAAFSVDEYEADVIKKHEKTRRVKEDDRTRHIVTLRAQTGVVFLTYKAANPIDTAVERIVSGAPLYDFTAADGIAHTLWRAGAADRDALVASFGELPELYIADGHHRAASAWRARSELGADPAVHPPAPGAGDFNTFLAVAFPHDQVQILPYHRVVADLGGRAVDAIRAELEQHLGLAPGPALPALRGQVGVYLGDRWWQLALPPAESGSPVAALDCQILQESVLAPILGIGDLRTDPRVDFVGGIRGPEELERRVDSGAAAIAFALHPVTVEDLLAVSDAGEIMPPKSTWFEPKLRDGLLVHEI